MTDTNGTIMVQEDKVLEIWRNYFCELLNREDPANPIEGRDAETPEIEIAEPTRMDVKNAIQSLKTNRAPGLDNIPAELLKNGGETLHTKLFELILIIWRREEKPAAW